MVSMANMPSGIVSPLLLTNQIKITAHLFTNSLLANWPLTLKALNVGKDFKSGVPFKATQTVMGLPLKLESCTSESGVRNTLTVEHASTAAFLMEAGVMPPFPWKKSQKDVRYLKSLSGSTSF